MWGYGTFWYTSTYLISHPLRLRWVVGSVTISKLIQLSIEFPQTPTQQLHLRLCDLPLAQLCLQGNKQGEEELVLLK